MASEQTTLSERFHEQLSHGVEPGEASLVAVIGRYQDKLVRARDLLTAWLRSGEMERADLDKLHRDTEEALSEPG